MKKYFIKPILKTFLVILSGCMMVSSVYARIQIEESETEEVKSLNIMILNPKEQEKNEMIAAINVSTATVLNCLINFGAKADPTLALLVAKTVAANPSSQITTLNFAKNNIGDKFIFAILQTFLENHYSKLTAINFSRNKITDVGATAIAMSLLALRPTVLNLSGNQIGVDGVRAIMKVFLESKNLDLEELDFSGNNIGDSGALVIAESLLRNPNLHLRSLNIANNNISIIGIEALVHALLSRTTNFDFSHNNLNTAEETEMTRRLVSDSIEIPGVSLNATTTSNTLF